VTQPEIEKESLSFMSDSYFFVFPKNNSLIYPKKYLQEYLKERFKRIDTIKINRKDFTTLSIEITERKPIALWCDSSSLNASTSEKCYFLDDNGTIFVEAPYFSGNAYFRYYGLIGTSSPIVGAEYLASTTQFRSLSKFVSDVEYMSTTPIYLLSKENEEFTLILSTGAKIYFDMKEPLPKISSNLETLLHSGTFSTSSDPTTSIDYIDLRFGNKLYYKMK
jgi:hypothetical protein